MNLKHERLKKLSALALTAAMSMSLFSAIGGQTAVRATETEEYTGKNKDNTTLGTSHIPTPEVADAFDSEWSGSYVYYGVYDQHTMRFRVLDPVSTVYGGDTMLLDCDSVLYLIPFKRDNSAFSWKESDVREDLNGDKFYSKNGVFTEQQRNAIFSSTIGPTPFENERLRATIGSSTALDNDKLFVLDVAEAKNKAYGYYEVVGYYDGEDFTAASSRRKNYYNSNEFTSWHTRTTGDDDCFYIFYDGGLSNNFVTTACGVSPAMNIDRSKVVFSTRIEGSADEPGAGYKLTLLDERLNFVIPEGSNPTMEGVHVTVPYELTGMYWSDNNTLVITDKEYTDDSAEILYYLPVTRNGVEKTFEFDLPEVSGTWGSDYYVYIVAQTELGTYATDLASAPVSIPAPEGYVAPEPTPAPSVTVSATPSPSPEVSAEPTVTATPEPTGTATTAPTATATPTPTNAGVSPLIVTPTEEPSVTPTATPTVTPTTGPESMPTPTSAPDDSKIMDFVKRIYTFVLDREPEEEGSKFWTDELYNFKRTGAEVAQGFIFSPEFENRKTSDKDFVTILYKTFFGRDPETDGMNFWLDQLKTGAMDRVAVANGFIYSQEWADTCAEYGIRSGGDLKPTVNIEPTELTFAFVERMYTTAMNRASDKEGCKYWASELANFNVTGEQVGAFFFLSDEMASFDLSDKDFVDRLYKTFMDREADADGENYWLGVMKSGSTRADIVMGFTRSPEFTEKCIEARILPYAD